MHENFASVNVEKESTEACSLLNTVHAVLKIRNQEQALQEGSLEMLENLPKGVLGFVRKSEDKKLIILLNFDEQAKEFQLTFSECIFKLSDRDEVKQKAIRLDGFGGMILK